MKRVRCRVAPRPHIVNHNGRAVTVPEFWRLVMYPRPTSTVREVTGKRPPWELYDARTLERIESNGFKRHVARTVREASQRCDLAPDRIRRLAENGTDADTIVGIAALVR